MKNIKRTEPLTEEEIEKKLMRYNNKNFPHTRDYLVENLKLDPNFKGPLGLFVEKDLEEQYNKIRVENNNYPDLDFSKVPEVINTQNTKFTLVCNELDKDGNIVGEFVSNYRLLIINKRLPRKYSCTIHEPGNKSTLEDFIEKAKEVHGGKYDYSMVEYKNSHTKVKIFCNTCKKYFYQTPTQHTRGRGCRTCGIQTNSKHRTRSTDKFIKDAIKIHGTLKYDYSEVEYVSYGSKVKIFCNTCKEYFYQAPQTHLRGNGCRKCANKLSSLLKTKGTDEFIKDAIKTHGTLKYNYSEVEYKNSDTKVKIFCNTCKEYFYQHPISHIKGCGCPNCLSHKNTAYTTEEFIEKAREVHGSRFDYSKVAYVNSTTPVIIVDPETGESFSQAPHNHLSGKSNINNGSSGGEVIVKTWLKSYILGPDDSWAPQYRVNSIPNTGRSRDYVFIDFQVLHNNKTYWIEYNGVQHYRITRMIKTFSMSEEDAESRLVAQIRRDNAVRKYCEENNIVFIEIPYTYNTYKKVSEILGKIILEGKDPDEVIKIPEIDSKYIQDTQSEEEEQKNEEQ